MFFPQPPPSDHSGFMGLGTLPKLACCGSAMGREHQGLAVVTWVGAGTNQHRTTNEEALTPAAILVLQSSVPCLRNHKGGTGAATRMALRSLTQALQEKELTFSLPGHRGAVLRGAACQSQLPTPKGFLKSTFLNPL